NTKGATKGGNPSGEAGPPKGGTTNGDATNGAATSAANTSGANAGGAATSAANTSGGNASGGDTNGDSDATVDAIVRVIKTEKSPLVLSAIAKSIDTLGRDRVVDALIPLAESSPSIKEALYELGVTAKVMSEKLRAGQGAERIRAAR